MARPLRIEYPGAWYHVVNRGRRREKIFIDVQDYKTFLEVLGRTCKLFSIEVHGYALMPNHYHILVRTPESSISRAMRRINGVYAQKFNIKNKIDDSLFRGRYKSILIEEESYLLELVRYIHRNPLKANLEEKLGEYKWCSHRGYMRDSEREEWLVTEYVLGKFSRYEKEAKRKMTAFVLEEIPKDLAGKLEGVHWPSIMGGKKFTEKIKSYLQGEKIDLYEIPEYNKGFAEKNDRKEIRNKMLGKYGDTLNKRRDRTRAGLRRALIYTLREETGMTLSGIAEIAGGITYSAVSNQHRKAEEEIARKEGCYREVEEVMKFLSVK